MDVNILREALKNIPGHNSEIIIKAIAEKLANTLAEQVCIQKFNHNNP